MPREKVSTRQDPLGKGVEVRSGNGPLGFFIRYGEFDPNYESPSLGRTALTVLCVAPKYSHWLRIHSIEADAPAAFIGCAVLLL